MGAPPLQIVASGAPPFVQVSSGAPPFTVVTGNAPPIMLVADGAPPITLLNEDGSIWAPGPPAAPVNTLAPSISGGSTPPIVGETLFANRGTWTGQPVPTYTYQWKRGGVAISGATGLFYTLVTADLAAMITVTVTATNTQGNASATSAAVGPVAAGVAPPVNSVAPVASGSVSVGSVVSVTTGTWSGSPTYAYQWQRGGVDIAGATALTYTLVSGDIGAMVRCVVTATNAGGAVSANSNALGPVTAAAAPVNTVAPVVAGSTVVGSLLSCNTGTWSGGPTGYAYQWKRSGTGSIAGATNSTYTLVTADLGTMIMCDVTATNATGSTTASSNSVGPITSASTAEVGGAALLHDETDGFAVDFTYATDAKRVAVKVGGALPAGGDGLLIGEAAGLGVDFTYATDAKRVGVRS